MTTDVVTCPVDACGWAGAHALVGQYRHCPRCGEVLAAEEVVV